VDLHGVTLITGPVQGDKSEPVDQSSLEWLREYTRSHQIPLLIEADGARGKPLKAPGGHEPPIPEFVDLVVQVAGLSGLGNPIDDQHIHRPATYSKLSELNPGDKVTIDAMAKVLLHPAGGMKNIPEVARRVVLLNQADTPELQAAAGNLAKRLGTGYDAVLVAKLQEKDILTVHEKVAGVILAAGGSLRFGRPKQLLDWSGEPFVRAVARTALAAGLSPVMVIAGAEAGQVRAAVMDLPVQVLLNEQWVEGQASSIRLGVSALDADALRRPGAAIFLLVDQPQVSASILSALVEVHARQLPTILAPMVMDQRANPVLFDRRAFADLLDLKGDVGGRAVFSKHKVEYLPWHDDSLLLDVDTPEQYEHLRSRWKGDSP
jgi:molybdenum cofactor cytidylyltransferase